jgi:hypothetical protein
MKGKRSRSRVKSTIRMVQIVLVGVMAWCIMFPLLLGEYVLFGKWDWLRIIINQWNWSAFIFFGALTVLCSFIGFVPLIVRRKEGAANAVLAGLIRWFFVLVTIPEIILQIDNRALFVAELPVMMFSFVQVMQ